MDISVRARELGQRKDVVFNLDVQFDHDARRMALFLADIHEDSPKIIDCDECGAYIASAQIFRCTGTREEELTQALACLDLLLGYSGSQGIRKALETRVLELQARGADSYTLRCKIYRKGHSPDNGLPIAWLTGRHSFKGRSSYVVPENEMEQIVEGLQQANNRYTTTNQPRHRQHGTTDAITTTQ